MKSLTGFFAVPKGEDDIRIVYDASVCGLNDALWCPNCFLPTIDSVLRNAGSETWFGDIDLGEMFLNFQLDEKILPWVGVDVSELEGLPPRSIIARWEHRKHVSLPWVENNVNTVLSRLFKDGHFDLLNPCSNDPSPLG